MRILKSHIQQIIYILICILLLWNNSCNNNSKQNEDIFIPAHCIILNNFPENIDSLLSLESFNYINESKLSNLQMDLIDYNYYSESEICFFKLLDSINQYFYHTNDYRALVLLDSICNYMDASWATYFEYSIGELFELSPENFLMQIEKMSIDNDKINDQCIILFLKYYLFNNLKISKNNSNTDDYFKIQLKQYMLERNIKIHYIDFLLEIVKEYE